MNEKEQGKGKHFGRQKAHFFSLPTNAWNGILTHYKICVEFVQTIKCKNMRLNDKNQTKISSSFMISRS